MMLAAAVYAAPDGFTLSPSQGVRLSDRSVTRDAAADLRVETRGQGQEASLALTAARIQAFTAPPALSELTAEQIAQYPDAVSPPAAGSYYVVQARDGRYYLCQLTTLKKTGRSAASWRLTFTCRDITVPGQPVATITPTGTWQGRREYADGAVYEGEFLDDQRHGHGVYTWPDGTRYEGDFDHGRRQGQGAYTWPDGTAYRGGFQDGLFAGHGVLTWPDGSSYDGEWAAGRRCGRGVYRWADGARYEGEFRDDRRCGVGTLYDADGTVVQQGMWEDDKFLGPGGAA